MKIKIEPISIGYQDQFIDNCTIVPRVGDYVSVKHNDGHFYNICVKYIVYDYFNNYILVIVNH